MNHLQDFSSSLGFYKASEGEKGNNLRYKSQQLFPNIDIGAANDRAGKKSVVSRHSLPKILPEVEQIVNTKKPEDIIKELIIDPKSSFLRHYKLALDRLEI